MAISDISLIRIHELQSGDGAINDLEQAEIAVDKASFTRAQKLSLGYLFNYILRFIVKPAMKDELHPIAYSGRYDDLESIPQHLKEIQDPNKLLASDYTGHVEYTDPVEFLKIKTIDL